jgi:MFS family permease
MNEWKQISVLLFSLVPEGLLDNILTPLYPYVVRALPGTHEDQIAWHAALLQSAYYLPLFLMNTVWGWTSDNIGRKPVLEAGLFIMTVTCFLFSTANSYAMAFAARFLAGLFGANSTVAKSMLADISYTNSELRAMSFAMYGMVYGVAGVIGPALGSALSYFSDNSQHSAFVRYPYFWHGAIPGILGYFAFIGLVYGLASNPVIKNPLEDSPILMSTMGASEAFEEPTKLTSKLIMIPISLYATIAYLQMAYLTMLPIYFKEMSFSSSQTSAWMIAIPMAKLVLQLGYSKLVSLSFSTQFLFRIGMMILLPVHILIPFVGGWHLTFGAGISFLQWPLLFLVLMALGLGESLAYLSALLLISERAPRANLGRIHGIASTLAALSRTVAPVVVGWLWGWFSSSNNQWIVFWISSAISIVGYKLATM